MTEYVVEEENEMSLCHRNTNLWCFLNTIGVHVRPVRVKGKGEHGNLVALVVSAGPMPFDLTIAEDSSLTGIGLPMKGDQVSKVVSSPKSDGSIVVDFPSKR